jgi:DNA-binding beta-propeller fold protein YncE
MQTKRNPPQPARFIFVDPATWKEAASLDLPGKPSKPVAVGDLFYVIDPGEKNAPGKVHVVDPAKRNIIKSIDVGSNAIAGGSDRDGNLFVLSQGADRKSGQVVIVRGGEVAGTYSTVEAPQKVVLSADGKRLYVIGNQFGVVDLAAKSALPGMEAAAPAIAILPTRDGRRVITVAMQGESCCRINVFDTASNKRLTSFLGGSKGKRIGQGLAAAALSVASFQAGRAGAGSSGYFTYSIYSPMVRGSARGPVALAPGEKKAYAVDIQTNEVTVVDMETGQRTMNLDAGSGLSEVIPLPDAGLIAAVSDERIDLIDPTSDTVRESIKMNGDVQRAVLTPDEKRLVVYGKGRIVVIDTTTGKQVAMIDALKSPSQIIFLK